MTHAIPLLVHHLETPESLETCRFCDQGDNDALDQQEVSFGYPSIRRPHCSLPLNRPCYCQGSSRYVRIDGLNHWCIYSFGRPSTSLSSYGRFTHRLVTLLLVILLVVVLAGLCKVVDIYIFGHTLPPLDESWWLYLLGGTMVVAMIGLVYLTLLCVIQPEHFPFLIQPDDGSGVSFLCCDQSTLPWYCFYFADFAVCSGDARGVVLVSFLIISFGVMGALTGTFRLIEAAVERVARRITDRSVD